MNDYEEGKIHDSRNAVVAEGIQIRHPAWLVIWGESSRRYWACAWLLAPSGTWLSSADPNELVRWMEEYERRHGWAPGRWRSSW